MKPFSRCRSEPQVAVLVTRTIASRDFHADAARSGERRPGVGAVAGRIDPGRGVHRTMTRRAGYISAVPAAGEPSGERPSRLGQSLALQLALVLALRADA